YSSDPGVTMQPVPRLPGYLLLKRLGGGPMTTVFEARDQESGSACAVKVLRPDWSDQSTAAKLLQREARAGLAVSHRHLVRVTHAHVLQPPYFLVMDLLSGESLRQRLQREYRLAVADALWITRQTAEALVALHEQLLAQQPEDRPRARSVVQQLVKLEIATLRPRWRRAG